MFGLGKKKELSPAGEAMKKLLSKKQDWKLIYSYFGDYLSRSRDEVIPYNIQISKTYDRIFGIIFTGFSVSFYEGSKCFCSEFLFSRYDLSIIKPIFNDVVSDSQQDTVKNMLIQVSKKICS